MADRAMNMGVGVKEGKLSEAWRQNLARVQAIAERRPDLHRVELVTTCVTIGGGTFAQLRGSCADLTCVADGCGSRQRLSVNYY